MNETGWPRTWAFWFEKPVGEPPKRSSICPDLRLGPGIIKREPNAQNKKRLKNKEDAAGSVDLCPTKFRANP